MRQYCKPLTVLLIPFAAVLVFSCKKSSGEGPSGLYNLSYGDSIIYLRVQSDDYVISPVEHRPGRYEGFPEGIEIDEETGEINVSKSETGLRYRITHTATNGVVTTIKIVLSGITFTDKYYRLSQNDSIAFPVYNATPGNAVPVTGSIFDEGNGANSGGCSVRTTNGQINLAESVRNGIFGAVPKNDERRDFDIVYRLNDPSNKAVNKIRVRLYYYERMSDVPDDLLETLFEREQQGVFLRTTESLRVTEVNKVAKPRPPCVIIVNQ